MKHAKQILWLFIAVITIIGLVVMGCIDQDNTPPNPCAEGHDMQAVEGEVELAPTCTETGFGKMECTRCGHIENDATIPKLDHKWEWDVTELPNCVFAGVKVRVCEDCEAEETDEVGIDEDEHDIEVIGEGLAPTCLMPGHGSIKCKRTDCNYSETGDSITPRGHNFVEHWDVFTAATCIAQGLEERFCTHDFCDRIADPNNTDNHYRQTQPIAINPNNHTDGCNPTSPYVITGSGTAFTANIQYSLCGNVTVGTANQTIANTLTAIRTHANGAAVTIQFGNGGDNVLNIGTATATFNNTGGTWGLITLTGRITAAYHPTANEGTIILGDDVSINSTADIANTEHSSNSGRAIRNNSTGIVTISSGTVSTGRGIVIQNISTGTVNILGGTIRATTVGNTVTNNSTGTVNISGGTIQAGPQAADIAIWNGSTGTVTITGTNTVITSVNRTSTLGTINNSAGGRIEISGGTITNTDNSLEANAIRNSTNGIITLSNCTVQSTNGYAIMNTGLHDRITIDSSVTTQGIRLLGSDHDSSVPAANCDSPHICAIAFCDYVIEPAGHSFSSLTLADNNIQGLTDIAVNVGNCLVCNYSPGQTTLSLAEYIHAHSAEGTTAATAVPLKVSINLGTMGTADNGLTQLLTALNSGGKLVALDLSGSTRSSNGAFTTGSLSNTATPGLAGLRQIASLVMPNHTSVTSIGNNAFRNCTNLTSVTIGTSVTNIDSSAFQGCTGLTSITIPNSVTSIGYGAFMGCTGLTSITIPDSVISIGGEVFWACTGLTSVTIGSGVTSIGNNVFMGCDNLASITVDPANTNFTMDNGVLFSTTAVVWAPPAVSGSVTIPNGVTSIGQQAFAGRTGLTSVTIPASVTNIGILAFSGCTGLISITFQRADTTFTSTSAFMSFPNADSLQTAYTAGGIGTYIRTGTTWAKQ